MEEQTYTPPTTLTPKTVLYWSTSAKRLEGVKQGKAIVTKARKLLDNGLVNYDSLTKSFKILPLVGYNSTTYTVKPRGDGHFQCNCQFYCTVSKDWEHPTCSHIQAVKFKLEMERWNAKTKE